MTITAGRIKLESAVQLPNLRDPAVVHQLLVSADDDMRKSRQRSWGFFFKRPKMNVRVKIK